VDTHVHRVRRLGLAAGGARKTDGCCTTWCRMGCARRCTCSVRLGREIPRRRRPGADSVRSRTCARRRRYLPSRVMHREGRARKGRRRREGRMGEAGASDDPRAFLPTQRPTRPRRLNVHHRRSIAPMSRATNG
jgi:hypothetical protein